MKIDRLKTRLQCNMTRGNWVWLFQDVCKATELKTWPLQCFFANLYVKWELCLAVLMRLQCTCVTWTLMFAFFKAFAIQYVICEFSFFLHLKARAMQCIACGLKFFTKKLKFCNFKALQCNMLRRSQSSDWNLYKLCKLVFQSLYWCMNVDCLWKYVK